MILSMLIGLLAGTQFTVQEQRIDLLPYPWLEEAGLRIGCFDLMEGYALIGSEALGGLSDIAVDQEHIYLISDAGYLFRSQMSLNDDGIITTFSDVTLMSLRDAPNGVPQTSRLDAEGIALDGEDLIVSIEGQDRIVRYVMHEQEWVASEVLLRDDAEVLGINSGYEGLTKLADGRYIAIAEGVNEDGLAKVRVSQPDDVAAPWAVATYRPEDLFQVTAVSQDPLSGDLLILERAYSPFVGPRAHIVRVPIDRVSAGTTLEGISLARMSLLDGIDNMEGIWAHRNAAGELIAHIISDDNFSERQRNVLMAGRIDETEQACRPRP